MIKLVFCIGFLAFLAFAGWLYVETLKTFGSGE